MKFVSTLMLFCLFIVPILTAYHGEEEAFVKPPPAPSSSSSFSLSWLFSPFMPLLTFLVSLVCSHPILSFLAVFIALVARLLQLGPTHTFISPVVLVLIIHFIHLLLAVVPAPRKHHDSKPAVGRLDSLFSYGRDSRRGNAGAPASGDDEGLASDEGAAAVESKPTSRFGHRQSTALQHAHPSRKMAPVVQTEAERHEASGLEFERLGRIEAAAGAFSKASKCFQAEENRQKVVELSKASERLYLKTAEAYIEACRSDLADCMTAAAAEQTNAWQAAEKLQREKPMKRHVARRHQPSQAERADPGKFFMGEPQAIQAKSRRMQWGRAQQAQREKAEQARRAEVEEEW